MSLKLPVGKILLTSMWMVYKRRQAFLRVLILPLTVLTGASFSFYMLISETSIFVFNPDDALLTIFLRNTFYVLFSYVVGAIFSTPFAISCHRLVLGADSTSASDRWRWTKRETRFAIFVVMICVAAFFVLTATLLLLAFPISIASTVIASPLATTYLVSYVGPSVAIIATSYITCRLAIIFPSIAVDKPLTIRSAWEMSRRNGWRLLIIAIFFFFFQITAVRMIDAENLISVLVSIALFFTLSIFGIVALSLSYLELQNRPGNN